MSEQITGQHFSPRSQWCGSTLEECIEILRAPRPAFYRGVCIECGQLAIDWVKTRLRHSDIDQPCLARPTIEFLTPQITQAGPPCRPHGRCHYRPVIVVINLVSMTCCYRYNDHRSIGRYRPYLVRPRTSPLIGQMTPSLASDWSLPARCEALTPCDGDIAAPVTSTEQIIPKLEHCYDPIFDDPPIFFSRSD